MNHCERFSGNISKYIDGDLQRIEHDFMEGHSSQCPSCKIKLQQVRLVVKRLPALPRVKVSPTFDMLLHARLRAENKQSRRIPIFPVFGKAWQIPVYAAAASILIGLGVLLDRTVVPQYFVSHEKESAVAEQEYMPVTVSEPSQSSDSSAVGTHLSRYVGLAPIKPRELLRREGIALSSEGMRQLSSMQRDSLVRPSSPEVDPRLRVRQANASIRF
jgi:hypothetical protein